ncbi:hypothetical protein HDU87_008750 [Geranomyces variabilis]|uniref:Uncharacterized protein n=1 Tax=Geranomyces variabilis TaxID=109894 RepID=A0AAD5TCK0_9FUNG|nr:hypothetical protein HDU87_008750 [Geranomyces variabilis]
MQDPYIDAADYYYPSDDSYHHQQQWSPQLQMQQSPWVAYAGLVLATTAAFLVPALLADLLVFLWKWFGLSAPADDDEEEEEAVEGEAIVANVERRFAELQQQLSEAQRRIGYLEKHSMNPSASVLPPPPPPPAPPVMQIDSSLKIVQSSDANAKRRAVQPEVAQTSMGAVLQELFNVQKRVVDIISPRKEFYSPRTKYLIKDKSAASTKPPDSLLRRNLAAEWAPLQPSKLSQVETVHASPTTTAPAPAPPSKALENIKNVKAAMNAAYNRKPSPESAVHNPSAVPKGLTPAVANAVEVKTAEKDLPVTPTKRVETLENDPDQSSAEAKDPMAEVDFTKAMSRLRPTNIPRSPGGTTLIPQRKGSRKTLHDSDFAMLKEKFKMHGSSLEAESSSASASPTSKEQPFI